MTIPRRKFDLLDTPDRRHSPRYISSREYESPIHEYRIRLGITVKELSGICETNQETINKLAYGTTSPFIHGSTELKPCVKKLLHYFNADVETMFPRYFCDFQIELDDSQIIDSTISTYSQVATSSNLELIDLLQTLY